MISRNEILLLRRTYLVANEWNELQDYRKTSVGLQMITMIALLHWLKLENWAAITSGFHTGNIHKLDVKLFTINFVRKGFKSKFIEF